MILTGAFLAEHAEIVDHKLDVTGGVLDWAPVPRAGVVDDEGNQAVQRLDLVIIMQAGEDDKQLPYHLKVEMVTSTGQVALAMDGDIPADPEGGENRFWVAPLGICAAQSGRMVLLVTVDQGEPFSLPIDLRVDDTP